MNQPDLGITIAELRVQKGFTQEKLAEEQLGWQPEATFED